MNFTDDGCDFYVVYCKLIDLTTLNLKAMCFESADETLLSPSIDF